MKINQKYDWSIILPVGPSKYVDSLLPGWSSKSRLFSKRSVGCKSRLLLLDCELRLMLPGCSGKVVTVCFLEWEISAPLVFGSAVDAVDVCCFFFNYNKSIVCYACRLKEKQRTIYWFLVQAFRCILEKLVYFVLVLSTVSLCEALKRLPEVEIFVLHSERNEAVFFH